MCVCVHICFVFLAMLCEKEHELFSTRLCCIKIDHDLATLIRLND